MATEPPSWGHQACQGLCHSGSQRKTRTPACWSPDGGRSMEPSGCCCHLMSCTLFAHLPGALLTPRAGERAGLCGSWVSSWQANPQSPRQSSHGAPLPPHSETAGQSHTSLDFQPGVLNYDRVSTYHLPKTERAPLLLAVL